MSTRPKPKHQTIHFSQLKLDSDNPRLPRSMHGKTEEEILTYMLLDASLIELMLAIGENDYLQGEQIFVVKDFDEKYKVIEGNRRLSAVMLLNNPQLAKVQKTKIEKVIAEKKHTPTEIPCLIFPDEKDVHNYLGYRHVTGIKEWRLLEKARYMSDFYKVKFSSTGIDLASREIAKIVGSRANYVKRIIVGFNIYKIIEDESFYKIRDLDDTTFYFNYIADSLRQQNICKFLELDFNKDLVEEIVNVNKKNLKEWTHWLFEKNDQNKTRLKGDSSDLNSLNEILGNEEATTAFVEKKWSLEKAKELTGELDNQFKSFIKKSSKSLEEADRLVTRVEQYYDRAEDDIKNIRRLAIKVLGAIQEKKDEDEL